MHTAAVSGAQTYQDLCLASHNEEKRLAEMRKRQHAVLTGLSLYASTADKKEDSLN